MKILFKEQSGITRFKEPITFGVPFPCGAVKENVSFQFKDADGNVLPYGFKILGNWHDGSLKWVLFDVQVSISANDQSILEFTTQSDASPYDQHNYINIVEENDIVAVTTGELEFRLELSSLFSIKKIKYNAFEILPDNYTNFVLTDELQQNWYPFVESWNLEHDTSLKKVLYFHGYFKRDDEKHSMHYKCRLHLFAQKPYIKIDLTVLNPEAAFHPEGAWDLGDKNSIFFQALRFVFQGGGDGSKGAFYIPELDSSSKIIDCSTGISIYQDSSGNENWQSKNHIDKEGTPTVFYRGYKINKGKELVDEGLKASPLMGIEGNNSSVFCYCENFWQNFPKDIQISDGSLSVGLFPDNSTGCHELQPGEQKTHSFYIGMGNKKEAVQGLKWTTDPLRPHISSQHYYNSLLRPRPVPPANLSDSKTCEIYQNIVDLVIKGEDSFISKNTQIDEYGWRNFGDVHADHETVFHQDPKQFISHYNNQYDVIKGSLLQYMRTGETAWFRIAKEMADHVSDIDIYHTRKDKYQFNHGMFWHTEHHLDAATSTHRTISIKHRALKPEGSFGGGPAPDHNYATGFLYLYWLTGETRYKEAVLELASNILSCVNGPDTLCELSFQTFRKILKNFKGFKGFKIEGYGEYEEIFRFNGPGRVTGNSLNTLLDAYLLTADNRYLEQGESLIRMCVSLNDDFEQMDLLNVELRWMYTIFLQALGRYLDIKKSMGQFDISFCFARAILIKYAKWMAEHEYYYLDNPDKLEFPNETWAAQEIRKSDVFAIAAYYAPHELKNRFIEKSEYFFQQSVNQILKFDTKSFTRPLAIMMTNGMSNMEMKYEMSHDDYLGLPEFSHNNISIKKSNTAFDKFWNNLMHFSIHKELAWIRLQFRARFLK